VRACAVETHVKISKKPRYMEIYRTNAAAQLDPTSGTRTLCEPARSKSTSTFHKRHQKSHFARKITGKMPRPRLSPERRHTHFVRACAVETHVKISQEQLYAEIYRTNAAAQLDPTRGTRTLREPARSKCTSTFYERHQKSHFRQKVTGKMPQPRLSPERGHTFCASVRAPAFTLTVRTPQCGHAVWGQINM